VRLSDLPKVTEQISDTSESEPRRHHSFVLSTGKERCTWNEGQSALGRRWMDQATAEKWHTQKTQESTRSRKPNKTPLFWRVAEFVYF